MGRCRSRHRLAAGRKVAIAMTTRLVLLQGGIAPSSLPAGTTASPAGDTATEKKSGWVVPRPQRWTTPYSKPSERATSPQTAHRLRDDPSADSHSAHDSAADALADSADCAFLGEQSCAACSAKHPSSCLSLGIREPGITAPSIAALGIRDIGLSQAGGDPPDCA